MLPGRSSSAASSRNALLKELHRLRHISLVSQVASSNQERTTANTIGDVAVRLGLLGREVRDLAALLLVASVAVEHHAGDLVLDGRRQTLDGGGHDGCALAVAAGDDDGVWALAGGEVEEALGFAVGGAVGSFGERVGADAGAVGASDALARDLVGAVLLLEAFAGGRADGRALENLLVGIKMGWSDV